MQAQYGEFLNLCNFVKIRTVLYMYKPIINVERKYAYDYPSSLSNGFNFVSF